MAKKNSYENLSDEEIIAKLTKDHAIKEKTTTVREHKFPTEFIDLPSGGLIYPKDSPLHKGKVEMKYMTAVEEDILSSANLIQQGIVLDRLIEELVVGEMDYKELNPGDKNALLVAARILGHGKDYTITLTCPKCTTPNPLTVDLTTFSAKEVDKVEYSNGNEFEIPLPNSNRTIKVKLINGYDQDEIKEKVLASKEESDIDRTPSITLAQSIVEVDGNRDKKYIDEFVKFDLFTLDIKEIKKKLNQVTPDINRNGSFVCKNKECKHTQEYTVPIGLDFFWPGA